MGCEGLLCPPGGLGVEPALEAGCREFSCLLLEVTRHCEQLLENCQRLQVKLGLTGGGGGIGARPRGPGAIPDVAELAKAAKRSRLFSDFCWRLHEELVAPGGDAWTALDLEQDAYRDAENTDERGQSGRSEDHDCGDSREEDAHPWHSPPIQQCRGLQGEVATGYQDQASCCNWNETGRGPNRGAWHEDAPSRQQLPAQQSGGLQGGAAAGETSFQSWNEPEQGPDCADTCEYVLERCPSSGEYSVDSYGDLQWQGHAGIEDWKSLATSWLVVPPQHSGDERGEEKEEEDAVLEVEEDEAGVAEDRSLLTKLGWDELGPGQPQGGGRFYSGTELLMPLFLGRGPDSGDRRDGALSWRSPPSWQLPGALAAGRQRQTSCEDCDELGQGSPIAGPDSGDGLDDALAWQSPRAQQCEGLPGETAAGCQRRTSCENWDELEQGSPIARPDSGDRLDDARAWQSPRAQQREGLPGETAAGCQRQISCENWDELEQGDGDQMPRRLLPPEDARCCELQDEESAEWQDTSGCFDIASTAIPEDSFAIAEEEGAGSESSISMAKAEAQRLRAFWKDQAAKQSDDAVGRKSWRDCERRCRGALREAHASEPPLERRGHSWGRTLAYAKAALGAFGAFGALGASGAMSSKEVSVRRGTAERPFVIWVLCAADEVEVWLAQRGFLDGANSADDSPTVVVLLGAGLATLDLRGPPGQGQPPAVVAADYLVGPDLMTPDLVVVFMPGPEHIPEIALQLAMDVPTVISTRFELQEQDQRALSSRMILPQMRNPFAACPDAAAALAYDDNGWIFAVYGDDLARACDLQVPVVPRPLNRTFAKFDRLPVCAWGILDVKFDATLPVLDRLKVLEAGDGKTSHFSGDGREIRERFDAMYRLEEPGNTMHELISSDKKLMHDLVQEAGYEHLLPQQACFPREYNPMLAGRLTSQLHLSSSDHVVLKLANKTRAAGVVVVKASDLDSKLRALLMPPADSDWLKGETERFEQTGSTGLHAGDFEECKRHWWSNESPIFLAERLCSSSPCLKDGKAYDATLRVAFALYQRSDSPSVHAEWLGCYWKLPKATLRQKGRVKLHDCVVSAVRTAGTAEVDPAICSEAYAALGDLLPRLFGRPKPTASELQGRYEEQHPALAAYLTTRLGVANQHRDKVFDRCLSVSATMAISLRDGQQKQGVNSHVQRWRSVLAAKKCGEDPDPRRDEHLRTALSLMPLSANAHYQVGVGYHAHRRLDAAVACFRRSAILDPDFKQPYVYLGVCHLQSGEWKRALDVSEAGMARHPGPQFQYHIGVALANLTNEDSSLADEVREQQWRRALESLRKARSSSEATLRFRREKAACKAPWLQYDDDLYNWLMRRFEFPWESSREQPMPEEGRQTAGWCGIKYRV